MMTVEQATRYLRSRPECRTLIEDAYLGEDVEAAADRFEHSGEFEQVCELLHDGLKGGTVLDLGAGNGVAARSFVHLGAKAVFAVEPYLSEDIGARAIRRLVEAESVWVVAAVGEQLPFDAESCDVVYVRQVLHHTRDLDLVAQECFRVLRSGGTLLATREHVVDDKRQLQAFLRSHPVHVLAGGENAFPLPVYRGAFAKAGFELVREFGPWDAIINAFPDVRTQAEFDAGGIAANTLRRRFGWFGEWISRVPAIRTATLAMKRARRTPGRHYSWLLRKP